MSLWHIEGDLPSPVVRTHLINLHEILKSGKGLWLPPFGTEAEVQGW